uniref:Uncharacterized protein n=1 Tax=Chenopodium quinoa TaxID=63459 RepID=A0A803L5W7_CHEQI
MHKTLKAQLKETLNKVSSRISLTCDMWTSCQTEEYLCLTTHYVNDNWKLISTVLNFSHIDSPHTGNTMYAVVLSMLQDWGIDDKIFCFTLDNASSNDRMQDYLKETLLARDVLLYNELEHDDDDILRTMTIEMKSKFDKYWFNSEQDDYGTLFAFAMILDPRCKLSVLKFCYENIFGDVEATLREYDDKEASSSFGERSILDVYLENPKLDRKAELGILAFWKENEHRYKGLSHLARDILAVPLTTVASESTFSIWGSSIE